jgi:L-lysine 6-transaminase
MWQQYGVAPDVVAFGKKTQVCGIYASSRVDEVPENVFVRSSRINSTWGANLVDMVRAKRIIEIILDENLHENAAERGKQFVQGLRDLAKERSGISNVRGVGTLVAFTCENNASRDALLSNLMDNKILALASGEESVRFRMSMVVTADEINLALERIGACLPTGASA